MNAILYLRFSPRPDADTTESIETQRERCRAWCTGMGHAVGQEFADREMSGGRADNRPGLQAAIKAVCASKGLLVCYSLSRLARNVRDALEISDRLRKCGANLALLDLNIDTSGPMGRCVFTILAAVAELERNQIRQRTSDAMQRHQSTGRKMGSVCPWGWRDDPEKPGYMLADTDERKIAWTIGTLAGAGHTPSTIAIMLNRQNVPTRGKSWYHTTIKKILEA